MLKNVILIVGTGLLAAAVWFLLESAMGWYIETQGHEGVLGGVIGGLYITLAPFTFGPIFVVALWIALWLFARRRFASLT